MKLLAEKNRLASSITLFIFLFLFVAPALAEPPDVPGLCDGFAKAFEKTDIQCAAECDLKKKARLLNLVIDFQKKMDLLACPDVASTDYLCGEVLNDETTFIFLYPPTATLSLEEGEDTVKLNAEIQGTACKDGSPPFGEIQWISSDPGVATVTQDGLVTATGPGSAGISAVSVNLPQISGTAQITVTEEPIECDADGDGRLDPDSTVGYIYCTSDHPVSTFFQEHCGIGSICPAYGTGLVYVCKICGNPETEEVHEARSGWCVPGEIFPCAYWGNLTPVP